MISTETSNRLLRETRCLYREYGPRKPMGRAAPSIDEPHYFLLRRFLRDNDLLVIFNTQRCRYQCSFCDLPKKASHEFIPATNIETQYAHVIREVRHALSILTKVTISNDGSVLDTETFPEEALLRIARAIREIRTVTTVAVETRLEFATPHLLKALRSQLGKHIKLDVLTGFETADPAIRDEVLLKKEPLEEFLHGLDCITAAEASLTAYVLFKPSPDMTDDEAYDEAKRSIVYLASECKKRCIDLSIRLNPMYAAMQSRWARQAATIDGYLPPRLTDCMHLAETVAKEGTPVYLGLSTEGLSDDRYTYKAREDYYPGLTRYALMFNERLIDSFPWEEIGTVKVPDDGQSQSE